MKKFNSFFFKYRQTLFHAGKINLEEHALNNILFPALSLYAVKHQVVIVVNSFLFNIYPTNRLKNIS